MNAFIQAYQAPFCDRYRYWTGLLLLIRVFLHLISYFTAGHNPNRSLLPLILTLGVLFVLRMTYAKKLYKQWPVDWLDTVLLFNLFVYATVAYAYDDDSSRVILACISVSFTCILLMIVVVYHIYAYVLISLFPKLKREKLIAASRSQQKKLTIVHDLQPDAEDRFAKFAGIVDHPNASRDVLEIPLRDKAESKVITHTELVISEGEQIAVTN